jgi:hypothetical protein
MAAPVETCFSTVSGFVRLSELVAKAPPGAVADVEYVVAREEALPRVAGIFEKLFVDRTVVARSLKDGEVFPSEIIPDAILTLVTHFEDADRTAKVLIINSICYPDTEDLDALFAHNYD